MEIFLIFLVILLVFGAKRIPEIARGLGKGISEFKRATSDLANEFDIDEQSHSQSRIDQQRHRPTGTRPQASSAQQQYQPAAEQPASEQPPAESSTAEADKKKQAGSQD